MNLRNEGSRWLPVLGYLVYVGSLTWIITTTFANWHYDDPYITYRYALNLRNGLGFVYNPGEQILSTTSPFFVTLLASLPIFQPQNIPALANFLGALSISLGAICIFDFAKAQKAIGVGLVGLLLYPTAPLLLATLGSEIPIFLFFCLGAFAFYSHQRFIPTILFLVLASLTRPDGLIVATILLFDYLIRAPGRFPWRAILLFAFLVAPWLFFAWVYFGSPIPATLFVKQNQARMAISPDYIDRLAEIFRYYFTTWQGVMMAALMVTGWIEVLLRNRDGIAILTWPVLSWVVYGQLGVSGYFWYYALLIPGIVVTIGLGLEAIRKIIRNQGKNLQIKHAVPMVISVILVGTLLMGNIQNISKILVEADQRSQVYSTIGDWLEKNTPQEAQIATLETGVIGFYAERAMIDFAGLVDPQISSRFTEDTTYEDSAIWVLTRYQPDYVVLQKGMFPDFEENYIVHNCRRAIQFQAGKYHVPATYEIFSCLYN